MNLKVLQLQSAHLGALITKATGETATRGDLVAKLVEEVGELSKASRLHGHRKFGRPDAQPGTADAVLDELGDCLFLLGRLADAHGIDAEMAGERAVAKVIERITTAGAGDMGALIDLPQGDEDDGPPFFWAGAAMDNMERARELVLEGRLADAIHLWGAALAQLTVALERAVGGDMHALIDTRTFPVYGLGFQVLITQDRTTPGWAREEITRGAVDLIAGINRKLAEEEARGEAHKAALLALMQDRPLHLGRPNVCHLCAREIKLDLGPTAIWGPAWRNMAGPAYEVHQVCADLVAEGSDPAQVATELEAHAVNFVATVSGFNGDDLRAAMELEARFNLAECHRRDLAKAINQKGAAAVAAELAADTANMERIKAGGQVEVFLGVDVARPDVDSVAGFTMLGAADQAGHRHIRLVANLAAPVAIAPGPVVSPIAEWAANALDQAAAVLDVIADGSATAGTCWCCGAPFSAPEGCEYCAGKGVRLKPGPWQDMAKLLTLAAKDGDLPVTSDELVKGMAPMDPSDVADLVDMALKAGRLSGTYEGMTLTDKGAALIGAAVQAPSYGFGQFKAGQALLWFPMEGRSEYHRVVAIYDIPGTNDCNAYATVERAGKEINARVSHLLTPEAWAEMIKPAPLAPLALKWGADMKKMLAIVDSEPERAGGVTHAETVAACGWLDGQQVTDLVDLAMENALLTGDNQGLKLTDKGRKVMTPAFGPFKAGKSYMYFPGDWSSPHYKVKVRQDHPATNDVLDRVHVVNARECNGELMTARVLKLMTMAEYAEHFSE